MPLNAKILLTTFLLSFSLATNGYSATAGAGGAVRGEEAQTNFEKGDKRYSINNDLKKPGVGTIIPKK